jgi:hypothetical protein
MGEIAFLTIFFGLDYARVRFFLQFASRAIKDFLVCAEDEVSGSGAGKIGKKNRANRSKVFPVLPDKPNNSG